MFLKFGERENNMAYDQFFAPQENSLQFQTFGGAKLWWRETRTLPLVSVHTAHNLFSF